jgi:cytochrome c
MNKLLAVAAIALSLASGSVLASDELARAKNCQACHAAERKMVGPSYKDIAARYAKERDAATRLARKIRDGGVGVWGQIPMPANPQVSEAEALTLARWILATK